MLYYNLAGKLLLDSSGTSLEMDRVELARILGAHPRQLHIEAQDLEATVISSETYKVSCTGCGYKIECSCGETGCCECVEAQTPSHEGFCVEDYCHECFRAQDERLSLAEIFDPSHPDGSLELSEQPRKARGRVGGKKSRSRRAHAEPVEDEYPFAS
jgi:hypothetical protein